MDAQALAEITVVIGAFLGSLSVSLVGLRIQVRRDTDAWARSHWEASPRALVELEAKAAAGELGAEVEEDGEDGPANPVELGEGESAIDPNEDPMERKRRERKERAARIRERIAQRRIADRVLGDGPAEAAGTYTGPTAFLQDPDDELYVPPAPAEPEGPVMPRRAAPPPEPLPEEEAPMPRRPAQADPMAAMPRRGSVSTDEAPRRSAPQNEGAMPRRAAAPPEPPPEEPVLVREPPRAPPAGMPRRANAPNDSAPAAMPRRGAPPPEPVPQPPQEEPVPVMPRRGGFAAESAPADMPRRPAAPPAPPPENNAARPAPRRAPDPPVDIPQFSPMVIPPAPVGVGLPPQGPPMEGKGGKAAANPLPNRGRGGRTLPVPDPSELSPELIAQIRELDATGRRVIAFKTYREATGVGFREAEEAVRQLLEG